MRKSAFGVCAWMVSAIGLAAGCTGQGGGTGTPAADVVLTASSTTDYGTVTVGTAVDKTFVVANQGAGDATLSDVSTTGLGLSGPFSLDRGGTCQSGTVLAGGKNENCTLIVRFAPSSAARTYTDLVVKYVDPTSSTAQSNPTPWQLVGTGADPTTPTAHVTLSSMSSPDFGSVAIGNTATLTLTVLNNGTAEATLSEISSASLGLAAPFSLVGGSCSTGTLLEAGSSCTLVVQFQPTEAAQSSANVALSYVDPSTSSPLPAANGVTLQGTGFVDCVNFPQSSCPAPSAAVAISDGPTFGYGNVAIGNSQDHTFTVTNTGAVAAALGTVDEQGLGLAAPFSLIGGTCTTGQSLAAKNGSCTLVVRFAPSAQVSSSATISLGYQGGPAGQQTSTRALTGAGVLDCNGYPQPQCPPPAPAIAISGSDPVSYGNVAIGNFADLTLTVTNSGTANAVLGTVTDAAMGLSAPLARLGGSCETGSVLTAKGGSCTIAVRFTPTATGTVTQTLSVGGVSRVLTGTGVVDCFNFPQPGCPAPAPLVAISNQPSFSFGNVAIGNYQEHTFTVTNQGNKDAQLSGIDTAAENLSAPYSVTGGSCATGQTLAAKGGSCTLVVRFAPEQKVTSTQTVQIQYTGAASAQTATVGVSGTGVIDCFNFPQPSCPPPSPALAYSAVSANFGNAPVEMTSVLTVTVYNQGQGDAKLGTVSGSGLGVSAPFAYVGGSCSSGQTLPALTGQCTLTFSVTPTVAGNISSGIELQYGGAGGAMPAATLGLYANGVVDCSVPALYPAYVQGVNDALSVNAAQAAKGTADGQAAGYQAGYNAGYQATYQADYNSDYNQAYQSAYNSVYQSAYNNAYNGGCSDGTNAGATDGYNVGNTDGSHDGYNAGYNDSHGTGYNDGYNAGYADGQSLCAPAPAGSTGSGSGSGSSGSGTGSGSSGSGSGTGSTGTGGAFQLPTLGTRARAFSSSDPNQNACYGQGYGQTLNPNAYQNAYNAASSVSGPSYQSGYTDGSNAGATDAYNAAVPKGTADGQAQGQADGATNGSKDGYNACYPGAYNTAYNDQYAIAYKAAYATGSTDGYNDGYSSGYADGKAAGENACPYGVAAVIIHPAAVQTHALERSSFGAHGKWVINGPNGLKLDVYVTPPIRHGIATSRLVHEAAVRRMNENVRPGLRYQARKQQIANLPNR